MKAISDSMLRDIFNKFDIDKSGSVSSSELAAMTRMLKMDLSPADLKQLMQDADSNGNGEIEFGEFKGAVKRQLGDGNSGLVAVIDAGTELGWFNPLSWFGGSDGKASEPECPPKGVRSAAKTPYSVRSTGRSTRADGLSPTHRMWATQGMVQAANRSSAEEVKEQAEAGQARKAEMKQRFLERQQRNVKVAKQQHEMRAHAVELLKHQKRYEGWEMKVKHSRMQEEEKQKKKDFAASANARAGQAKLRKAKLTKERHEEAEAQGAATVAAAKAARAQRREQAKATQRAEAQEAKEYTAKVRYETRREVREEGKIMFQEQRDAIVAAEKRKQEVDAMAIADARARYLERQQGLKAKVEELHYVAKVSRLSLIDERREQAAEMRYQKQMEAQRAHEREAMTMNEKRSMRDQVVSWQKNGIIDPS